MESVPTISLAPVRTGLHCEEAVNTLTHAMGLVLSIAGLWQLLHATAGRGSLGQIAGLVAFGGSMAVVYLASTLYHAVDEPSLKQWLRICDHAAIYLLIAGTYTPFLLALPEPWSTWGLGAVWTLALIGVCFKMTFGVAYERWSVAMYLALGWLGILAIEPMVTHISAYGVVWLIAGGLTYTCGTMFYLRGDLPYSHAIWHVFVLLGSALHWGAVAFYVMPHALA